MGREEVLFAVIEGPVSGFGASAARESSQSGRGGRARGTSATGSAKPCARFAGLQLLDRVF